MICRNKNRKLHILIRYSICYNALVKNSIEYQERISLACSPYHKKMPKADFITTTFEKNIDMLVRYM